MTDKKDLDLTFALTERPGVHRFAKSKWTKLVKAVIATSETTGDEKPKALTVAMPSNQKTFRAALHSRVNERQKGLKLCVIMNEDRTALLCWTEKKEADEPETSNGPEDHAAPEADILEPTKSEDAF